MPKHKKSPVSKVLAFHKFIKTRKAKKVQQNPRDDDDGIGGLLSETYATVAPGVAGYVVTKALPHILYKLLRRKTGTSFWAQEGTHKVLAGISSLVVLLGLYVTASKVKRLRAAKTALLIGSAVAIVDFVVRNYLPGMAWLVGGETPTVALLPAKTRAQESNLLEAGGDDDYGSLAGDSLSSGFASLEDTDDDDLTN